MPGQGPAWGAAARRILAAHEYTKHGIVPLEEVFEKHDSASGPCLITRRKKIVGPGRTGQRTVSISRNGATNYVNQHRDVLFQMASSAATLIDRQFD
jgi:hypothetical protein